MSLPVKPDCCGLVEELQKMLDEWEARMTALEQRRGDILAIGHLGAISNVHYSISSLLKKYEDK